MATTLTLTRDGSTLNLNDGSNYRLQAGWRPKITKRKKRVLGGSSTFEDVTESIPIQVIGTSENDALANLGTLYEWLDHAHSWNQGERVDEVILNYKPNGATGTTLKALIKGYGDDDPIVFDSQFNEEVQAHIIETIISVRRTGAYLSSEETKASSTVTLPALMTATFDDDADIPSPYDVTITSSFTGSTSGQSNGKGFIVLSSLDDAISIEGSDEFTNTSDVAGTVSTVSNSKAYGGNYKVISFDTAGDYWLRNTSPNTVAIDKDYAIFISCKPATISGAEWVDIWIQLQGSNTSTTKKLRITGDDADLRQVLFVGVAAGLEGAVSDIQIRMETNEYVGGGATNIIHIDYLAIVALDHSTRIIAVDNIDHSDIFKMEHLTLEKRHARPNHNANRGNFYCEMEGDKIYGRALLSAVDGTEWLMSDTTAVTKTVMSATRRKAYTTPK